jgi:hypothetical protein
VAGLRMRECVVRKEARRSCRNAAPEARKSVVPGLMAISVQMT